MCECCGGDCRLCGGTDHLEFPEVITRMYVREVVDKDGCRVEELIINDKWKLIATGDPSRPFRREDMERQPLNEAYQNEILEAYQKISDTFDDFTQLMRKRVPYEQWPDHCKIAGVDEHLLGPASPDFGCAPKGTKISGFDKPPEMIGIPDFAEQLSNHSDECVKNFAECVKDGWPNVQSTCRPDESFRAMLRIMINWMAYLESKEKITECNENIWDILKARGLDPTKAFPMAMISRLEDIGRAQQKLKDILDSEIFENTSKHSPYWHSDHCLEEDKLDEIRGKISCLSDNLWDLWAILRKEEEL